MSLQRIFVRVETSPTSGPRSTSPQVLDSCTSSRSETPDTLRTVAGDLGLARFFTPVQARIDVAHIERVHAVFDASRSTWRSRRIRAGRAGLCAVA